MSHPFLFYPWFILHAQNCNLPDFFIRKANENHLLRLNTMKIKQLLLNVCCAPFWGNLLRKMSTTCNVQFGARDFEVWNGNLYLKPNPVNMCFI